MRNFTFQDGQTFACYCGDCLQLMECIPDESIDMVLVDLPYGVTRNPADVPIPLDELWKLWYRIAKRDACIALFAQGLFYVDLVMSNRKDFRYDLVWDKVLPSGFLNANKMPLRVHEQIAIFYRRFPPYTPQFWLGAPSHSRGHATGKPRVNRNYGDFESLPGTREDSTNKHPRSILRYSKTHPSLALHRTEKPTALLEWLIRSYTCESAVVLDCCMGSGSTGVACATTGRRFIGMEIDAEIFKAADLRIRTAFANSS
jgi:site-specific DNA-methyltransferase (adenine-specific)